MMNNAQPSMGGFSEHNERSLQHAEIDTADEEGSKERLLLDNLLEQGFAWEEASKLLHLHDHLYENTEMRQRQSEDYRMQFARWLYEQGEINER